MATPPMASPARAGHPAWSLQATCRHVDADRFFPPVPGEGRSARLQREAEARDLCHQCPVQEPCLDYALAVQEPHGIWGGLTAKERRALLRQQ